MNEPGAAIRYHEQTAHGAGYMQAVRDRTDFHPMDPLNRPDPFKRYAGLRTIPLPADSSDTGVPAVDVLAGTASSGGRPMEAGELARLLFFTAGVTRAAGHGYFRATQSAGNLHPVEVYVACADIPGLEAGLYHFAPLEFGLHPLRRGDVRPSDAPVSLVLSGIPWRTSWKYGERGLRHVWWDAGSMLANALAIAEASGWEAFVSAGFPDDEINRLIGADGASEFAVAVVSLGRASRAGSPPQLPELDVGAEPLSARPVQFDLVTQTETAGVLDAAGVEAWRRRAIAGDAEPVPLPGQAPRDSIEEVILRRGSTRIFRRETVPGHACSWALAASARPAPTDFGSLCDHYVAVHAVDGVRPGLYRFGSDDPVSAGDEDQVRATSRHLCLDQPLGGDSAYTVFHCADLERVLGALGARGYRCAQMESGLVSGRLHLAAFALGLGATGLTFYDGDVSEAFATKDACMLVTAAGVPAYRSRPGGRPGRPAELAGFERLMDRMMETFKGR